MSRIRAATAFALAFVATTVQANAAVNCKFQTNTGVNFGNYDVFNGATTSSNGNMSIRCTGIGTGTDSITVTLSRGHSTTYSPRFMVNGASQLNYNLYLNALGTQIWGDGTKNMAR